MKLTREFRCGSAKRSRAGANTWAGSDTADRFEQFWTLRLTVAGRPAPTTGYLCDVHALDALMRDHVAPRLRDHAGGGESNGSVATAVAAGFEAARPYVPGGLTLDSIVLFVSPYTRFEVSGEDAAMVRLTRSFEFSAAHRLYCEGRSDEENRRLFGKCSNPHGHGHNYVLEVTVCGEIDTALGTIVDLPRLDRVVTERVIDPLDHKHLNVECPEFAELNPSAENIARVIFKRLDGAFERAELSNVRVWETPKTFADVGRDDT